MIKIKELTPSQIKRINRVRWYYRIKFILYTVLGFALVGWGVAQFPVSSAAGNNWILGIFSFLAGIFLLPVTRWGETSIGKRIEEDKNYEINAIHRESREISKEE